METNTRRRGIIKREQVRVEEREGPGGPPAGAGDAAGEVARCARAAGVRLLRLDELTQALEFTCSCGEVSLIEIQCETKP